MQDRMLLVTLAVVLVTTADSKPSENQSRSTGVWRNFGLGKGVWGDKSLAKVLSKDVEQAAKFLSNKGFAEGFWRKYFCAKWLNWPWVQEETTFSKERISQMRTLVGSCTVDVGTCPFGTCSNRTFNELFDCPGDGYICPVTETRTADCGMFGQRQYQYVTDCKCCIDGGINITGVVTDSLTGERLRNLKVHFGKKLVATTGSDGGFSFKVDTETKSALVRAIDKDYLYMDAVKIIDIPDDFRGPFHVELVMIKKSTPVEISSTVETILSVSDDPANPDAGNAFIVISPDSFKSKDGKPYSGPLNASITFVDANAGSEAVIPGRFLTPVGNSLENMISDGIVAFDFKDADGNELTAGPVKFIVRKGMQLWDLNPATGLWEPAQVLSGRRRRQVSLTEEYLFRVQNSRWYNIDKIPGAPRCYFKARVFNTTNGNEITSSSVSLFQPEILGLTAQNQRLRLYTRATSDPSGTCFEVRCPVAGSPDDAMTGFINMTSLESVSVGSVFLPSFTHLKPKPLDRYHGALKAKLADVQYEIAPNGLDIFVNYVSNVEGPFYTDYDSCAASSQDMPAFHFYKPEPPIYEPVPSNSDICSARIAFRDSWNFFDVISGMKSMPSVTAISIWEQNGQSLFYTDKAILEKSTEGDKGVVFACVNYRCSPDNNEDQSVTATTVYLDININNITHSYTYMDINETLVTRNVSMPAFYCDGYCDGPLCHNQGVNVNGTSIDGAYTAQDGPDFVNLKSKDCSGAASFAYEFYCHSNEGRESASREEWLQLL